MTKRLTIEEMQSLAKKRGGKCLSTEYVNCYSNLDWVCTHGHPWSATPSSIKSGGWCPICSFNRKRDTIEVMQSIANDRGGWCLSSEYVNQNTKLRWKCAHGHTWLAVPGSIKNQGSWCGVCSSGIAERICRSYFRQIFGLPFPKRRPRWLKNSRGNQMELDGYCQELYLAFEHQGGQHYEKSHHFGQSDQDFTKRQIDDRAKVQLCKERGIRLVCVPALFTMTKLDDFQQWLYTECQKLGIEIPQGMLTKKVNLKSAWVASRTTKMMDLMHSIAKERGGKCLSTEYLGAFTKLKWECANGHRWDATSNSVKNTGNWCSRCDIESRTGEQFRNLRKRSLCNMHELAELWGIKCLSTTWVNKSTKLEWECAHGHRWEADNRTMRARKHKCQKCRVGR